MSIASYRFIDLAPCSQRISQYSRDQTVRPASALCIISSFVCLFRWCLTPRSMNRSLCVVLPIRTAVLRYANSRLFTKQNVDYLRSPDGSITSDTSLKVGLLSEILRLRLYCRRQIPINTYLCNSYQLRLRCVLYY